jgi:hypothetical protein
MTRFVRALVVLSALLLGGCSDGDGSSDPGSADVVGGTRIEGASNDDPDAQVEAGDGLVFTRAVGTTYELNNATVDCQESAEGGGETVVRLTSPAQYEKIFEKGRVTKPFFYVEALPGTEGRADLPLSGGDADAVPPVTVFGVDSADQSELNGNTEVATGSITILEATCDPEPRLSFTIRATLGSENGLLPMHVVGGLSAGGES